MAVPGVRVTRAKVLFAGMVIVAGSPNPAAPERSSVRALERALPRVTVKTRFWGEPTESVARSKVAVTAVVLFAVSVACWVFPHRS